MVCWRAIIQIDELNIFLFFILKERLIKNIIWKPFLVQIQEHRPQDDRVDLERDHGQRESGPLGWHRRPPLPEGHRQGDRRAAHVETRYLHRFKVSGFSPRSWIYTKYLIFFFLLHCSDLGVQNITLISRTGEPELELEPVRAGCFWLLGAGPFEKKTRSRSRSRLVKKSRAGASKKLAGSSALLEDKNIRKLRVSSETYLEDRSKLTNMTNLTNALLALICPLYVFLN